MHLGHSGEGVPGRPNSTAMAWQERCSSAWRPAFTEHQYTRHFIRINSFTPHNSPRRRGGYYSHSTEAETEPPCEDKRFVQSHTTGNAELRERPVLSDPKSNPALSATLEPPGCSQRSPVSCRQNILDFIFFFFSTELPAVFG